MFGKNNFRRRWGGFCSVALFLVLWQIFSPRAGGRGVLPSPLALLVRARELFSSAGLGYDVAVTVSEIVIGVAVGTFVGLFTAFVFFRARRVEQLSFPLILIVQITPKIALAPLFVLWFGIGLFSKVWLVALVTFFPVLVNSLAGLRSIDPQMFELSKILELGAWRRLREIELPGIRENIFVGLKLGVLSAVTAAVIGEMIGARQGLGYVVVRGQESADVAQSMVAIILLGFTGLLFWKGIERQTEKSGEK